MKFHQALKCIHHVVVLHVPRCRAAFHHSPIVQFCIFCNNSILLCVEMSLSSVSFESPVIIFFTTTCFTPYFYEHISHLVFTRLWNECSCFGIFLYISAIWLKASVCFNCAFHSVWVILLQILY